MLDVLLVRIQPTDRTPKDIEYFSDKTIDFEISVLKGDPLQFRFSKEYYFALNVPLGYKPTTFYEKSKKIDEELEVNYGGHVVAIDKYPYCQFENGVKIDKERKSANSQYAIARYELECQSQHSDYDSIILLIPDLEPTVLSTLKFACNLLRGYSPSFIAFEQTVILSLTSPLGEVIGKSLPDHSETGLKFGNYHY